MDIKEEALQRKEFSDILYDLSKSQIVLQDEYTLLSICNRLEALYYKKENGKHFRHFYSDIYAVLIRLQENSELGSIDILGQNISAIKFGYKPRNVDAYGNLIDISDSINKLYDHISLDIARISYSGGEDRKISSEKSIQSLQNRIGIIEDNLKNSVENAETKFTHVEKKLDNSQKEYISILGIFSSVVLAFIGGLTFNTSVLNNIANASVYRLVVVSLIIGFVLSNIIFGLFYYVGTMVDKNLNAKPIIIFDAILCVLLLMTLIAWFFGWVEIRDNNIGTSFLFAVKGLL